jgi:hypothetical protein
MNILFKTEQKGDVNENQIEKLRLKVFDIVLSINMLLEDRYRLDEKSLNDWVSKYLYGVGNTHLDEADEIENIHLNLGLKYMSVLPSVSGDFLLYLFCKNISRTTGHVATFTPAMFIRGEGVKYPNPYNVMKKFLSEKSYSKIFVQMIHVFGHIFTQDEDIQEELSSSIKCGFKLKEKEMHKVFSTLKTSSQNGKIDVIFERKLGDISATTIQDIFMRMGNVLQDEWKR